MLHIDKIIIVMATVIKANLKNKHRSSGNAQNDE